jgi:hypothetical protein
MRISRLLGLAVLLVASATFAQQPDYLTPREFQNWVGFFAKHQADRERCSGKQEPEMQQTIFEYIDSLYPEQAEALKIAYVAAYAQHSQGRGGRAGSTKCNENSVARAQKTYDERLARLTELNPAPKSQVEADVRLSAGLPADQPTCIASPPGVQVKVPRGTKTLLSGGGRWAPSRGLSAIGTATVQVEVEADQTVKGWMVVFATSNAFKLYADMTAAVIAADSKGRQVWNPMANDGVAAYDSQLSMGMGNTTDTRRRTVPMTFEPSCDVAYLFMKSRFCGMQEDMNRGNVGDSCPGVYRGPDRGGRFALPLDTRDFGDFAQHLEGRRFAVGEVFDFGAWQGVRVR